MATPSPAEPLTDETTSEIPGLTRSLSGPLPDVSDTKEDTVGPSKTTKSKANPKKKARAPKAETDKGETEGETDKADPDAPQRAKRPKKEQTDQERPKSKRGQARPHRRLNTETIAARIEKLDKRITRAQGQLVEATRHVQGYKREMTFRPEAGAPKEQTLEESLEESLEKAS